MKRYFAAAGLLVLVFVLSCAARAAEVSKEPRGFRNIAWGQDFETLPDKAAFTLIARDENRKYYVRSGDDMSMDGVRLESVHYVFLAGRFIGAQVEASGEEGASRLLLFLQGRYGPGDPPFDGGKNYEWVFENVRIDFNYDEKADRTTLTWMTLDVMESRGP